MMRASRKLAILARIREAGVTTDRELAAALDLSRGTVAPLRRELVSEGLVEAVPAPEGAHYPIAGWRARS